MKLKISELLENIEKEITAINEVDLNNDMIQDITDAKRHLKIIKDRILILDAILEYNIRFAPKIVCKRIKKNK